MVPRSGIFRYIGFSKGSATQNHLYHNENVFRSIDMRRVSFAKNNFWDVWTSILIFWKKSYFCMNSRTKVHFWKIALKASLTKMIKYFFFKLFFQWSVLFDLDEILRCPGYVKVSAWVALKGCNNVFLIFELLGRKSGKTIEK